MSTLTRDLLVHNSEGTPWNVRIVRDGDSYGRNGCLTHTGEPLVEFYDGRADPEKFTPLGQFVARYYLSTLLGRCEWSGRNHRDDDGLCLNGGVRSWTIDGAAMLIVRRFLRTLETE